MVDLYTKAVLTVIAVALSVVAIRSAVPTALAVGDGCGSSGDPCYVTQDGTIFVSNQMKCTGGIYEPCYVRVTR